MNSSVVFSRLPRSLPRHQYSPSLLPSPLRQGRIKKTALHVLASSSESSSDGSDANSLPNVKTMKIDPDLLRSRTFISKKGPVEITPPPRICTLRAFSRTGNGSGSGTGLVRSDRQSMSAFLKSLEASIEFSAMIQAWEILSGRLAMLVFASAIAIEAATGNTIFKKMDIHRIEEIAAAGMIAILGAAAFAFAWRAKSRVMYMMTQGAENLVNSVIDNIIDSVFFDDDIYIP